MFLVGDAAHVMPIFAGEGGNHGLIGGVQSGDAIVEHGLRMVRVRSMRWRIQGGKTRRRLERARRG